MVCSAIGAALACAAIQPLHERTETVFLIDQLDDERRLGSSPRRLFIPVFHRAGNECRVNGTAVAHDQGADFSGKRRTPDQAVSQILASLHFVALILKSPAATVAGCICLAARFTLFSMSSARHAGYAVEPFPCID
jgi:hypothetical protein